VVAVGATYGQFCPVAKAMELLDERWTMLVVREMVSGSERFNEFRRGVPRMSPSLLSKRLQQLVRSGVVERVQTGNDVRYVLTEAGRELLPVVQAIGAWGVRWIGEIGDEDLDPQLLLWDMHRNVDHQAVPRGRTVIALRFTDVAPSARDWWLVVDDGVVDVCDEDPGFPVSVSVETGLRRMTEVWRGDVSWQSALRAKTIEVRGPERLRRALPTWFTWSVFAAVPRPA
jgi:DNA-binding HxlR family transcriptional regulator